MSQKISFYSTNALTGEHHGVLFNALFTLRQSEDSNEWELWACGHRGVKTGSPLSDSNDVFD